VTFPAQRLVSSGYILSALQGMSFSPSNVTAAAS
jgi:hypothetical protein